jgi:chromosome condensin MukBEF ATPase and DNA-binding subunit MukB
LYCSYTVVQKHLLKAMRVFLEAVRIIFRGRESACKKSRMHLEAVSILEIERDLQRGILEPKRVFVKAVSVFKGRESVCKVRESACKDRKSACRGS